MTTVDDSYAAALFQAQVEKERDERFLRSLTPEDREFVIRADKTLATFNRCLQVMMTETDPTMRHGAATWVATHAVHVSETHALRVVMRTRFMERDIW